MTSATTNTKDSSNSIATDETSSLVNSFSSFHRHRSKHQQLCRVAGTSTNRGRSTTFPLRLRLMLDRAEECGYQHIVSWSSDGDSFRIHDPDGMVTVLPMYFNQTRYKSFLRQLQNYGFHRVIRGPERGLCTHDQFQRSNPNKCLSMKKLPIMNSSSSSSAARSQSVRSKTAAFPPPVSAPEVVATGNGPTTGAAMSTSTTSKSIGSDSSLPEDQHQGDKPGQHEDTTWLGKLLNNQDLWMLLSTTANSPFEPNKVSYPETSEVTPIQDDSNKVVNHRSVGVYEEDAQKQNGSLVDASVVRCRKISASENLRRSSNRAEFYAQIIENRGLLDSRAKTILDGSHVFELV